MTRQELATRIWATANELRKTSRQASTRTIFLALCFTNTYQTRSLTLLNISDFIFNMYEMYHSESIENAFKDIDSLIMTGKPAW